jgi:tellurite methyltransferase
MSLADRQKWDAKYQGREPGEPSPSLDELARFLPSSGCALDVAGGSGRNSSWLLRRGLTVMLVDISEVALAIARAHVGDVPLRTLALDLDVQSLPPGPYDAIVCIAFLDRRVYRTFGELLAPGGTVLIVHPTTSNLERHESPPREFLLEPGELLGFAAGLEILHSDEGWSKDDRHQARLVARRPT